MTIFAIASGMVFQSLATLGAAGTGGDRETLSVEAHQALERITVELRRAGNTVVGSVAYPVAIPGAPGAVPAIDLDDDAPDGGWQTVDGEAPAWLANYLVNTGVSSAAGLFTYLGSNLIFLGKSATAAGVVDADFDDGGIEQNLYGEVKPAAVDPRNPDLLLETVATDGAFSLENFLLQGLDIVGDVAGPYRLRVAFDGAFSLDYQGVACAAGNVFDLLRYGEVIDQGGLRVWVEAKTLMGRRLRTGQWATVAEKDWNPMPFTGGIDFDLDGTVDAFLPVATPRVVGQTSQACGQKDLVYRTPSRNASGTPIIDASDHVVYENSDLRFTLVENINGGVSLMLTRDDDEVRVICDDVVSVTFDTHASDPSLRWNQVRIILDLERRSDDGRVRSCTVESLVTLRNARLD